MDKISLKGLDHVIVVTVVDSKIYFRIYNVGFSKSGTRVRTNSILIDRPNNFVLNRFPMWSWTPWDLLWIWLSEECNLHKMTYGMLLARSQRSTLNYHVEPIFLV